MTRAEQLLKIEEALKFKDSTKKLFGDVVKYDKKDKIYYVSSPNSKGYTSENSILCGMYDDKGMSVGTKRVGLVFWNSLKYVESDIIKKLLSM